MKIGLYALDPFSAPNPNYDQQNAMIGAAALINSAGFNWVVLASMHVRRNGSIYFNDTPFSGADGNDTGAALNSCINQMYGPDTGVLISFGGGGSVGPEGQKNAVGYFDFSHIQALISEYSDPADNPFFQNLQSIFDNYPGIAGVDIDLEANTESDYNGLLDTVITVVDWISHQQKIVSLCPYEVPSFWANVITQSEHGTDFWINVQNAPQNLQGLQSSLVNAGISLDRIIAGVPLTGSGPNDVGSLLQGLPSGLGGSWLWNFGGIGFGTYVKAMSDGLPTSSAAS